MVLRILFDPKDLKLQIQEKVQKCVTYPLLGTERFSMLNYHGKR